MKKIIGHVGYGPTLSAALKGHQTEKPMTQKIEINKKYRTRGGKPVRLTEVTKESRYPVKGFVEGDIHPYTWMIDGTFDENGETSLDLFEIVEEPVRKTTTEEYYEMLKEKFIPGNFTEITDPSELLKEAVALLYGVRETFAAGSNEENILMNRISKFLTKHSGRV